MKLISISRKQKKAVVASPNRHSHSRSPALKMSTSRQVQLQMIIHNTSFCYTSNVLWIILSELISISRKAPSPSSERDSCSGSPEDTSKSAKQAKFARKGKESQYTEETEELETLPMSVYANMNVSNLIRFVFICFSACQIEQFSFWTSGRQLKRRRKRWRKR